MHAVDALSAVARPPPDPAETWIATDLAVDGIDELLAGFLTRPTSRLRCDEDSVLVVAPDDVPDWWLVRSVRGRRSRSTASDRARRSRRDWELDGTAVELYLSLWDRRRGR